MAGWSISYDGWFHMRPIWYDLPKVLHTGISVGKLDFFANLDLIWVLKSSGVIDRLVETFGLMIGISDVAVGCDCRGWQLIWAAAVVRSIFDNGWRRWVGIQQSIPLYMYMCKREGKQVIRYYHNEMVALIHMGKVAAHHICHDTWNTKIVIIKEAYIYNTSFTGCSYYDL